MITPVTPETVLTVKLQAQQWNVVIAGLDELPHKISAGVMKLLLEQFQTPQPTYPAGANGIDMRASAQADYDPVPRPPTSA